MTAPGLQPLSDAEWPPEIADLRESFAGKLNVYRVMAHNPALLRAWRDLRGHVVQTSALTEQQREIVILRTGWHWRSEYEWAHHVWRGRRAGMSDARIARVREQPASWIGSDEDCVLLRATDRLLTAGHLGADALADLRSVLSDVAITDVMATIGFYSTLAFMLRTFETPIDAFVLEEPGL